MRIHWLVFFSLLLAILQLVGCGGGGPSPVQPPRQVQVEISISPRVLTVKAGGFAGFNVVVTGTTNQNVIWQVNGVEGGDQTSGTIANGLYSAPPIIPNALTVTVTAVAQADPTKSASATVTVVMSIIVNPSGVALQVSDSQCTTTQQFETIITGTNNTGVDWTLNGLSPGDPNTSFGTITTSGLYTTPTAIPVPPTVQVSGTLQADPTQSASSTVLIDSGSPFISQNIQNPPVKLGTSGGNSLDISQHFCCSGTLGALVTRGGTDYILSNNHVLARSGHAQLNEPITQPGLADFNCQAGTTVANFSQAVKLIPGGTSVADAALAQVVPGQVDPSGAILQLGATNCGAQPAPPANTTIAPAIGMLVAKSGRTTGLTCDTIAAINVAVRVIYENSCGSTSTFIVNFDNQIEIDSTTFSAPGDSGSLIVDAQTAQPVGLLFAGDSTSTLANPIQTVLGALADPKDPNIRPTFVGGGTHTVQACVGTMATGGTTQKSAKQIQAPSENQISRATTIKRNHAAALMASPGVVGVGVAAGDRPGEAAIVVFVDRKKSHAPIPATLDGIKTRVKSVEAFHALAGACQPENPRY